MASWQLLGVGSEATVARHHKRVDGAPPVTRQTGRVGDCPDLREPVGQVSIAQAKSVGGLAEPAGEVVVQVLLIVADPGDVAVGAQQDAWNIQYRCGIREVIDPV